MMRPGNTQKSILEQMRLHGPMTVEELSREVGVSSVAVRRHLETLEGEGLLRGKVTRRPGRGRPCRVFELTETAEELFPRNYGALALMVLEHLESEDGRIEEIFRLRRTRTEAELAPRLEAESLEARVRAVAEFQDRAGYMAEWEREEDGSFLLREHNCAICQVARRFPQACASELTLIENLTGGHVTREAYIAGGDPVCAYRIRARDLN